jgi:3-hydroxyisobutyrate dehydrogenase
MTTRQRFSVRRVAVLGSGIMGGPMARHLQHAGYEVRAWDIDHSRLKVLADLGVTTCATAIEAMDSADCVVTMLSDIHSVLDVVAGSQHALAEFAGLWLQSTTVGLEGTRRLADVAARTGATFVDVPLLGTRSSVEAGELIALASGPAEAEDVCRPLLESFSSRVLWLGDAGQGSKLKLVMNGWVLGLTTLTAETMALSSGLGLPPTIFLDMIRGGPLDVAQAQLKGAAIASRQFSPSLSLHHGAKDAGLIVAAGCEAGIDLSIAKAVAQRLEEARDAGHGDEDVSAVWFAVAPKL